MDKLFLEDLCELTNQDGVVYIEPEMVERDVLPTVLAATVGDHLNKGA